MNPAPSLRNALVALPSEIDKRKTPTDERSGREPERGDARGVELFDASRIGEVPWPSGRDGAYARDWVTPMVRRGTKRLVANVETQWHVLRAGPCILPVTVNDRQYDSSYVVSPFTHYVTYAKEEIALNKEMKYKRPLYAFCDALGLFLRAASINKTVHVNNWLLSTNLYPRLDTELLGPITELLKRRFPEHAIVFRSVNPRSMPDLHDAFPEHGYRYVLSRRVFMVDTTDEAVAKNRRNKADSKLLSRSEYEMVRVTDSKDTEAIRRIVELYNFLYLDKYSKNNPAFTEEFIGIAIDQGLLEVSVLRKAGRIDAVLGVFERNGVMTAPLVGYDPSIPQSIGLYRMLMYAMYERARRDGLLLNMSAGAAEFKKLRGGISHFEYSAVYTEHLSPRRRAGWRALGGLVNGMATDLIDKYDR